MNHFQTVGVIGKRRDAKVLPTVVALCQVLLDLGREVLLASDSGGGAAIPEGVHTTDRAEIQRRCSLIVVVGGDGTLLAAARDCPGLPILGINQGRLGFMVDVPPDEMRDALAAVFSGEHRREERLLLSASVRRGAAVLGPFPAVNDVVIRNQATIRMLEFETWLDGEFISQHRADGFIVSSPTGSTAYALSSGGPVLHPSLDAIALVPICPHTLSDRPIVVGARQTVRVVLRGGEGVSAMFTCDGQTTENLHPGDALEVRAAEHRLSLIHPRNYSYFNILRNKLHWGRGPQSDR